MSNKIKVLIAEDDASIANLYKIFLETQDFEVEKAQNGREALGAMKVFKPNVVLLDIMMPELSGFDVLEAMSKDNELSNIKVIVLSAISNEDERKKAIDYGVKAYYVKSQVVMGDIADKIRELE